MTSGLYNRHFIFQSLTFDFIFKRFHYLGAAGGRTSGSAADQYV